MFKSTKSAEPSSALAEVSGKLRIAAIIVLGIAAIIVLAAGRQEPECGGLIVREALVHQIGGRLSEYLGPGQVYELAWRPDRLTVRAARADGGHLCRAGFDYVGPDGPGLLTVDYAVAKPNRRGQVRLTDMRITRVPAGSRLGEASGSPPEVLDF